ncbi:MAG: hypothetical protein ABJC19_03890 [Gemmatimonadota bacterium]
MLVLGPGYPVRALDGAHFTEAIRTEVTTRVATSESHRQISRDARFAVTLQGDTLTVSADSLILTELSDGRSRTLDTDGFVGGRYLFQLDSLGRAALLERPFVPDDLIEVSDVGRAMDDFFPSLPPAMIVGAEATDASARHWRRLTDSSGVQRFRWTVEQEHNGTEAVADSVTAAVSGSSHEVSALAWSPTRGPLHWSRRIESDITTRLRGQTIRATVIQRIAVKREWMREER